MREEEINNPRYPHTIRIVRVNLSSAANADPDDPSVAPSEDVEAETVLYEGAGRAFTDTTTTGSAEVDRNKRKASIPVRFSEWETGLMPLDGDTVYATIGRNTEVGTVRDSEAGNNNTLVYWDFVRV